MTRWPRSFRASVWRAAWAAGRRLPRGTGGAYTAPSGDNVYVTGAANLTADGLSLESNLIEGERLSIRWETLLEMLGLSENEIDALLSLPTTDWDSALNELNDELAQAAETFGKLADPYLVTLADFAATLNIQQRRNVEAENGYPAVENEISITCTAEELSRLLHSLADQVEKDTALRPYLEQLIQNCDLTVTDGDSETTHVMSVSESAMKRVNSPMCWPKRTVRSASCWATTTTVCPSI